MDETVYQCPECNFNADNLNELDNHIAELHSNEQNLASSGASCATAGLPNRAAGSSNIKKDLTNNKNRNENVNEEEEEENETNTATSRLDEQQRQQQQNDENNQINANEVDDDDDDQEEVNENEHDDDIFIENELDTQNHVGGVSLPNSTKNNLISNEEFTNDLEEDEEDPDDGQLEENDLFNETGYFYDENNQNNSTANINNNDQMNDEFGNQNEQNFANSNEANKIKLSKINLTKSQQNGVVRVNVGGRTASTVLRPNQIHNLRQKRPIDYNDLNGTSSVDLETYSLLTSNQQSASRRSTNNNNSSLTLTTTAAVLGAAAANNNTSISAHPVLNGPVINSDNHYERQYTCKRCGFFTNNPRAVLYHRKEFHFEKINVHECSYCQYASQYSGKVERHTLLRHKIDINSLPAATTKKIPNRKFDIKMATPTSSSNDLKEQSNQSINSINSLNTNGHSNQMANDSLKVNFSNRTNNNNSSGTTNQLTTSSSATQNRVIVNTSLNNQIRNQLRHTELENISFDHSSSATKISSSPVLFASSNNNNNNQNDKQLVTSSPGGFNDSNHLASGTSLSSNQSANLINNGLAKYQCNKCPCKYKRSNDLYKHLKLKHSTIAHNLNDYLKITPMTTNMGASSSSSLGQHRRLDENDDIIDETASNENDKDFIINDSVGGDGTGGLNGDSDFNQDGDLNEENFNYLNDEENLINDDVEDEEDEENKCVDDVIEETSSSTYKQPNKPSNNNNNQSNLLLQKLNKIAANPNAASSSSIVATISSTGTAAAATALSNSRQQFRRIEPSTTIPEKKKSLECPYCTYYSSGNDAEYLLHVKDHLSGKSFRCVLCNSVYKYRGDCVVHLKRKHQKADMFAQNYVERFNIDMVDINQICVLLKPKQNEEMENEEKLFGCAYCDYKANYKGDVFKHQTRRHPGTVKNVTPLNPSLIQASGMSLNGSNASSENNSINNSFNASQIEDLNHSSLSINKTPSKHHNSTNRIHNQSSGGTRIAKISSNLFNGSSLTNKLNNANANTNSNNSNNDVIELEPPDSSNNYENDEYFYNNNQVAKLQPTSNYLILNKNKSMASIAPPPISKTTTTTTTPSGTSNFNRSSNFNKQNQIQQQQQSEEVIDEQQFNNLDDESAAADGDLDDQNNNLNVNDEEEENLFDDVQDCGDEEEFMNYDSVPTDTLNQDDADYNNLEEDEDEEDEQNDKNDLEIINEFIDQDYGDEAAGLTRGTGQDEAIGLAGLGVGSSNGGGGGKMNNSNNFMESTNQDSKPIHRFQCKFCSFVAKNHAKLQLHLATHYNLKPYVCPVCNRRANFKWDIQKHLRKIHNDYVSEVICLSESEARKSISSYIEQKQTFGFDNNPNSSATNGLNGTNNGVGGSGVVNSNNLISVRQGLNDKRPTSSLSSLSSSSLSSNRLAQNSTSSGGSSTVAPMTNLLNRNSSQFNLINMKKSNDLDTVNQLNGQPNTNNSSNTNTAGLSSSALANLRLLARRRTKHALRERKFKCSLCHRTSKWQWDIRKHMRTVHRGQSGGDVIVLKDKDLIKKLTENHKQNVIPSPTLLNNNLNSNNSTNVTQIISSNASLSHLQNQSQNNFSSSSTTANILNNNNNRPKLNETTSSIVNYNNTRINSDLSLNNPRGSISSLASMMRSSSGHQSSYLANSIGIKTDNRILTNSLFRNRQILPQHHQHQYQQHHLLHQHQQQQQQQQLLNKNSLSSVLSISGGSDPTGNKKFKCTVCPYRSNWKADLFRHLKKRHYIQQPQLDNVVILDCDYAANSLEEYERIHGINIRKRSRTDLEILNDTNKIFSSPETPSTQNDFDLIDVKKSKTDMNELSQINNNESQSSDYGLDTTSEQPEQHDEETSNAENLTTRLPVSVAELNIKPYKCIKCGFRSDRKSDTLRHIRVKHGQTLNAIKFLRILSIKEASDTIEQYENMRLYKKIKNFNSSNNTSLNQSQSPTQSQQSDIIYSSSTNSASKPSVHHQTRSVSTNNQLNDTNKSETISGGGLGGVRQLRPKLDNQNNATNSTPSAESTASLNRVANGSTSVTTYNKHNEMSSSTPTSASSSSLDYYKCPFCSFKHISKLVMRRHLVIHFRGGVGCDSIKLNPIYRCSICSFKSKWQYSVKKHIIMFHLSVPNVYVLKVISKKCSSSSSNSKSINSANKSCPNTSNNRKIINNSSSNRFLNSKLFRLKSKLFQKQKRSKSLDDQYQLDNSNNNSNTLNESNINNNNNKNTNNCNLNKRNNYFLNKINFNKNLTNLNNKANDQENDDLSNGNTTSTIPTTTTTTIPLPPTAKANTTNNNQLQNDKIKISLLNRFRGNDLSSMKSSGATKKINDLSHDLIIQNDHDYTTTVEPATSHSTLQQQQKSRQQQQQQQLQLKLETSVLSENENSQLNLTQQTDTDDENKIVESTILTGYDGKPFTASFLVSNPSHNTSSSLLSTSNSSSNQVKKKMYFCQTCPYKTNNFCNLKQHLLQHRNQDGYFKCRYCPYYVSMVRLLKQHEILHPEYVPRDNPKQQQQQKSLYI